MSGVTHSIVKRHTRLFTHPDIYKNRVHELPIDEIINFKPLDKSDLFNPYHDALVFSLYVANYLTKRILIDNGSSANIMFFNALREIQIEESKITRRSTILI